LSPYFLFQIVQLYNTQQISEINLKYEIFKNNKYDYSDYAEYMHYLLRRDCCWMPQKPHTLD